MTGIRVLFGRDRANKHHRHSSRQCPEDDFLNPSGIGQQPFPAPGTNNLEETRVSSLRLFEDHSCGIALICSKSRTFAKASSLISPFSRTICRRDLPVSRDSLATAAALR